MSAGIGWCWLVSSITPKSRLQSFLCCCKQSKLKDEPLFSFACKCFSHMLAGLILWNAIFKYKNRKPNRLVYRLATALLPMYLFVLVRTELAWSHRRLMMSHLKHAEQVGFFVCFMKKKSAVMPIWMCIYAKTTFYPFYVFIKLKIEKWNLFGLFFFWLSKCYLTYLFEHCWAAFCMHAPPPSPHRIDGVPKIRLRKHECWMWFIREMAHAVSFITLFTLSLAVHTCTASLVCFVQSRSKYQKLSSASLLSWLQHIAGFCACDLRL